LTAGPQAKQFEEFSEAEATTAQRFGDTGLSARYHPQARAHGGWRRDRDERAGQGLSVYGASADTSG